MTDPATASVNRAAWRSRWQATDAAAFDASSQRSGRSAAVDRLLEIAGPRLSLPGAVSIDIGCGTGLVALRGSLQGLIGIDVSQPMLLLARSRMNNVVQQDLFQLGLQRDSVDNVFCAFVVDDYTSEQKASFFCTVRELMRNDAWLFLAAYSPADAHMGRPRSPNTPAVHLESCAAYQRHLLSAGLVPRHSETIHSVGRPRPERPAVRREFCALTAVRQ